MKFCADHWTKLRAAIDARGLSAFVAHDGADAMRRTVEGDDGRSGFDPLMGAHNAIVANALSARLGGLAIMTPNEDGSERCPLCHLVAACGCGADCPFTTWVDRAADDQLARARELNLVGIA